MKIKLTRYILSRKIIFIIIMIFIYLFIFEKKQEFTLQAFYIPDVSKQTKVIYPDCWKLRFPLWGVKIICPRYAAPSFLGNDSYSFFDEPGQDYFIFILDMPLKKRMNWLLSNDPLWNRNCISEQRIKYNNENMLSKRSPGAYKIGDNYLEIDVDSFYFVFPNHANFKMAISVYKMERDYRELIEQLQSSNEISFELDFGDYEFEIEVEYLDKSGERRILEQRVGICVNPAN